MAPSHMTLITTVIKDLEALAAACDRLGLRLDLTLKHAKGWGQKVPCDAAIRIPGTDYNVGVVQKGDHYNLTADFFDPRLYNAVGNNCEKLTQAYSAAKIKKDARLKGHTVTEKVTQDGRIILSIKT